MIEAADLVRVLQPFTSAHPDQYGVVVVNGTTATLSTGADFDVTYLVKVGVVDVIPVAKTSITKLTFLRRMTSAQRIAIRQAAVTDQILADAMSMLDAAQDILTDDPDTVSMVQYCAYLGLIAPENVPTILA